MIKKVSVFITTAGNRVETLPLILRSWLAQPEADDIYLLDGGAAGRPGTKPFKFPWRDMDAEVKEFGIIPLDPDPGSAADYIYAPKLARNDTVILADDDIRPYGRFTADFIRGYEEVSPNGFRAIGGIIGRSFHGPDYHTGTTFYRADRISMPQPVGFAGVVLIMEKSILNFSIEDCPKNADDLFLQMKMYPHMRKFVLPVKDYQNLPCASDHTAMYRDPALKKEREDFYRKYFYLNLNLNK
jgi:hypothetical protein